MYRKSCVYVSVILTAIILFSCSGSSTADLLDAKFTGDIVDPLSLTPETITVSTNATTQFSAAGGKAPHIYSIFTGVGTINATTGLFTASNSSGSSVVKVTDSLGTNTVAGVSIITPPASPNSLAGLQLWLKADDMNGNGDNNSGWTDNDPVAAWADSSGNAANANQPGATNLRPLYVTNSLNGKPTIKFDGLNDATGDYLLISALNLQQNVTMVAVAKNSAQVDSGSQFKTLLVGACDDAFTLTGTGYGLTLRKPSTGDGLSVQLGTGGLVNDTTTFITPDDQFKILVFNRNGNAGRLFVNGTLASEGFFGRTSGFCSGNYNVGSHAPLSSNRAYTGDIAEMIVYTLSLSASNQAAVECHLSHKYGLNISGC